VKRHVAILGSTGSIGTQALDVIGKNPDLFEVEVLTAYNNAELLIEQAHKFVPNHVVVGNTEKYLQVKEALEHLPIKVFAGIESICQVVTLPSVEFVLTAMVGYAGLEPTIEAIKAKKKIALANKETLVVAGELITRLADENRVPIYPVDSEHSAIFQCLQGEYHNPIEKILLTASGGPFRQFNLADMQHITPQQALKHPNWSMGAKVTIDSASLMNKGLEAIEAKWLFGVDPSQIEVVVHPQSIIHSLVQFQDGSIKAQLGMPDMRLPIQYALSYPQRLQSDFPRFNFADCLSFTFEKPDLERFPNLSIAFEAMRHGGNVACAMNAANEIAVSAFLCGELPFMKMPKLIEKTIEKIDFIASPNLDDYKYTDTKARALADELVSKM
jgi:1-deoxy-D-xylulose-5-phosphate reductoisomerase